MFRYKSIQSCFVSSRDRLNSDNSTTSDFSIEIKLEENFDSFCVLSASIPKSFYTIHSPHNKFILYEPNNGSFIIELKEGNYTYNLLKNELQRLMNLASTNSYTVTTPSYTEVQTGKLSFAVSNNSDVQPSLIFDNYDLPVIMGFQRGETYTFTNNGLVSPNIVFLQRNDSLMIISDMIRGSLSSRNVILHLYNNNQDFGFITYNCQDVSGHTRTLNNNNGVYRFTLVNSDFDVLNLNGINMSFNIIFFNYCDIHEIQKKYIYLNNMEKLLNK